MVRIAVQRVEAGMVEGKAAVARAVARVVERVVVERVVGMAEAKSKGRGQSWPVSLCRYRHRRVKYNLL